MCGILGGNIPGWDYEKGIKAIAHRGPDDRRIERYPDFTLGFCRLSIRDLSMAAMQPMSNAENNVHIVYNGEIYGYGNLKAKLEKKYRFRTTSDTEVVLYAYMEYGEAFIDKVDGIFGMAIYDERIGKIFLFRDRAGVKPLYYILQGNVFGFASELKALKEAVSGFTFKIDGTAVYDYLFYQYIPDPKSIYQSVYKLPPATMLVYDVYAQKILKKEKYWKLQVNASIDRKRKKEDVSEQLKALLRQSVKNQLMADVPVGTFLSGGIDSSIITYEAAGINPQMRAFSIGFQEKEYDESEIAVRFCREKNIEIKRKVLNIADISRIRNRIREWYDEPFADTSAYPSYLVSEFARNEVTVVLTGDGGDELFGGYARYARFHACQKTGFSNVRERLEYERKEIRQGLGIADMDYYSAYAAGLGIPKDYNPYEWIYQYDLPDLPPYTRMRYLDFHTYLPGDILTKVDRVSMAVSLEARVPFLDRSIIEFAFSLSQEECNSENGLKACLKEAYDGIIPDEILYGQKKGFGIPQSYLWREKKAENIYAGILKEHWGEVVPDKKKDIVSGNENQLYKRYKRLEAQYHLLNQWMALGEAGITLEKLLCARGYGTIAIYGMSDIGKHVYHALEGSSIKVCYGMDQSQSGKYAEMMIRKPDEIMEPVDVLIVTAIMDFESIKEHLKDKAGFPIVSLEEILYETVIGCERGNMEA